MANRTPERWKRFAITLALSSMFVWVTVSGLYTGGGWLGVVGRLFVAALAFVFVGSMLFYGASLLRDWTEEQYRENESAFGEVLDCVVGLLYLPAMIALWLALLVLGLALLVGVVWLIKTIWYAV